MNIPPPGGTADDDHDDYDADMTPSRVITDDVIEAMLRHEPVDPAFAQLAAFARHVPAVGDRPVPRPSDELVAMFEGRVRPVPGPADAPEVATAVASPDVPAAERARPGTPRLASLASKVAGLGLVAKIGLGTSLAAASVAGGGAAGVLPPAANDTVRDAIEAVTPVEFTDPDDGPRPSGDRAPSVPSTGPGGTDGHEGDGDEPAIDDDAPAAGHGSGPAGTDGSPARPGATSTSATTPAPAGPGVPASTPAATAPSTIPPAPPSTTGQGGPPPTIPSTVPPPVTGQAVTPTTQAVPSRPTP